MSTWSSCPKVERPEREFVYSFAFITEVKKDRSYASTPLYAFMAKRRITFTLPVTKAV
jgi:hypothetical protein